MSCSITLTGITRDCKGMGGVKRVWLADRTVYLPEVTIINDEVSAISLGDYFEFQFRKQVASMETTINSDDVAGTLFYETRVTMAFAAMTAAKRLEIKNLMNAELLAIVEDNNGEYWLLGFDNACTLVEAGAQTGTTYADANQFNVVLSDSSQNMPYYIAEEVLYP